MTPRFGDGAATIRFQVSIGKDKLGGASYQDKTAKGLGAAQKAWRYTKDLVLEKDAGGKNAIGAMTAPIVQPLTI